jgi:6-phospho-3-hexuloisomerase
MTDKVKIVLAEVERVFASTDFSGESAFLEDVCAARQIVCVGAGRVGLALAGFAKRLRHLGKDAFWIEDQSVPRMGKGDLMVVGSGSGATKSIVGLAEIALGQDLRIALLTATRESPLSQMAHAAVVLNCPSKNSEAGSIKSQQPMTTLFEQAAQIYLDSVVLDLMAMLSVSADEMEMRHNVIE